MTQLMFSCRGLSKTFHTAHGPIWALRDLNFDLVTGGFTAVVGPSGCGKSTLLHIVAGLDTAYGGEIVVSASTRRKGFLFQSPRLLPWLTAEQNVAFAHEGGRVRRRDAIEAAHRYLRRVGLVGFDRQFPNQLSGGMQQRVALARALVVEPEVILMDEPFAALDELTARRMRGELLQLYAQSPCTVLFITHNVTEAAFLADRVVVMGPRPGRVLAEIPVGLPRPRDYDDPAVAQIAHTIIGHLRGVESQFSEPDVQNSFEEGIR
jgi:NitT/TauT family transport system ATP-binding protein